MRYRLLALLFAAAVVALLCADILIKSQVRRGEGLSAAEANRGLWNCFVPEDATDVWFTSQYKSTIVECKMSEQSFQEWCVENGGKPTQITADAQRSVISRKLGEGFFIIDGLYFMNASKTSPDIWDRGIYDRTNNRAYLDHSGG